jgi:hypothetical protein
MILRHDPASDYSPNGLSEWGMWSQCIQLYNGGRIASADQSARVVCCHFNGLCTAVRPMTI